MCACVSDYVCASRAFPLLVCLLIFFLCSGLFGFFCLFFFFLKGERERAWSWIGREIGGEDLLEDERKEAVIKIFYEKIYFQ